MTGPAYPAAQRLPPRYRTTFRAAWRPPAVRASRSGAGARPQAIEAITDAAFWASLRREEGYSPKISLAFLPPEQAASR